MENRTNVIYYHSRILRAFDAALNIKIIQIFRVEFGTVLDGVLGPQIASFSRMRILIFVLGIWLAFERASLACVAIRLLSPAVSDPCR